MTRFDWAKLIGSPDIHPCQLGQHYTPTDLISWSDLVQPGWTGLKTWLKGVGKGLAIKIKRWFCMKWWDGEKYANVWKWFLVSVSSLVIDVVVGTWIQSYLGGTMPCFGRVGTPSCLHGHGLHRHSFLSTWLSSSWFMHACMHSVQDHTANEFSM